MRITYFSHSKRQGLSKQFLLCSSRGAFTYVLRAISFCSMAQFRPIRPYALVSRCETIRKSSVSISKIDTPLLLHPNCGRSRSVTQPWIIVLQLRINHRITVTLSSPVNHVRHVLRFFSPSCVSCNSSFTDVLRSFETNLHTYWGSFSILHPSRNKVTYELRFLLPSGIYCMHTLLAYYGHKYLAITATAGQISNDQECIS